MATKNSECWTNRNGRWQKRFYYDGQRYSVTGSTKREANEKMLDKIAQIKAGISADGRKLSLKEFYEQFYRQPRIERGSVKLATIFTDDTRFAYVPKKYQSMKIVDFSRKTVEDLQLKLVDRQGNLLATSTRNNVLSLLYSVFKCACSHSFIVSNPCEYVEKVKRTEPEARETNHRALTVEEQKIFLQYAAGTWYENLFRFLIATGLRIGEATALTWNDIDYNGGWIHVTKTMSRTEQGWKVDTPKTKRSNRSITLNAERLGILAEQKRMLEHINDNRFLVFPSTEGNYALPASINASMRNIIKHIQNDGYDMQPFSAHAFRATATTRQMEQGISDYVRAKELGHARLTMTDHYTHTSDEMQQEQILKYTAAV